MENKIPFNLFGEKQELVFNIESLRDFELAMGKGIQQIVRSEDEGINFCLTALPFCLKKIGQRLYVEKINDYIESGGNLNDISQRIVHAIFATGFLGKTPKDTVLEIYYPGLLTKSKEESGKNE